MDIVRPKNIPGVLYKNFDISYPKNCHIQILDKKYKNFCRGHLDH